MSMSVQIKKKRKPSQALLELLEGLAPDFQKLQDKVDEVFLKGREEGFNDMQIGNLVRSKMKPYYNERTIQRVLPQTAKYTTRAHITSDKGDKMSANEREEDDEDTTIWQFNASEFKIEYIEQYDKAYLRTATEHFYAESRKWKKKYEELESKQNKPKTKPKQGTMQDKTDLISKAFAARQEGKI